MGNELLGGVLVAALMLIGLLHLVWAFVAWPFATREDFARTVVGRPNGDLVEAVFAPMSVGVAIALAVAAYLVGVQAELWSSPLVGWLTETGAWAVAAVLVLRAVAGFVESGARLGDRPEQYRRNDLTIYSPLCLGLGLLVVVVTLN